MTLRRSLPLALALAATPYFAFAQAQATVKPDGQFRYALGAGATRSSGNTDASSVNITAEGVRATQDNKWRFGGKALRATSDGATTAENLGLGTQYDQNFTPVWFGFGSLDYLRDRPANLTARGSAFLGAGNHVIKTDTLTWDLSAGLGYTEDRYVTAAQVNGENRTRYGRAEGLLAEESNHQWTATTSFHQKLSLFPVLDNNAGYRGIFDSGLSVAMNSTLSLTVGFNYRYNSDPGDGVKKGDTLFVTGIAVKID
jgi:putative salt-induced outer membrane protein YdiY